MRPGRLIIICGPAGVGKTTLVHALLERRPGLALSISATTRPPRPGEVPDVDYRFVSRDSFERMRRAGQFLETADVHGELYGTPRGPVEEALAARRDVVLQIDVQGARAVKELVPGAVTIFVEPPSWEALEARLRSRRTEDEARVRVRLDTARRELAEAGLYEHRVVNDDLDRAVDEVDRILDGLEPGEEST